MKLHTFIVCFPAMTDRNDHLPFRQVWDEITILEEAESGNQVTSVIKVPAQVFGKANFLRG